MKRSVLAMVVWTMGLTPAAAAQEPAPELESITQSDLRADLFFLASDAMQGRLTDTPENRIAAEFIRSRFERMKLQPAGRNGSFYHEFNLSTATLGIGNELVISRGNPRNQIVLRPGQDYYPLRFSSSGEATGELVFAGFGIVSDQRGHDDYRSESIEGRIVLVLDHEPGERNPDSPFDGLVTSEASRDLRKVLYAQDRGAAAVLFVSDVHNHPGPSNFERSAAGYWPTGQLRVPRYTLASWVERVRIPVAMVSPALVRTFLEAAGGTLEELAESAEETGGITPLAIPDINIVLKTSVDRHVTSDRSVVAMIEGSDPEVADELVIISAHYDHNGADAARIFNGADDDGSGTVTLIEIAEAYSLAMANGIRPRRSILFAAWNSEERGLLGAWAYVVDPLYPLEKTVAVLNMDMIGRNEEVRVGGGRRFRGLELQTAESNSNAVNIMGYTYSPALRAVIEGANRGIGLEVKMRYDNNQSNLLRRSDQWPFLQNGVPAVFVHTGLHPDYHTEFDRPERINYVKMEKIARLVHQVSWTLAQAGGRPGFQRRVDESP